MHNSPSCLLRIVVTCESTLSKELCSSLQAWCPHAPVLIYHPNLSIVLSDHISPHYGRNWGLGCFSQYYSASRLRSQDLQLHHISISKDWRGTKQTSEVRFANSTAHWHRTSNPTNRADSNTSCSCSCWFDGDTSKDITSYSPSGYSRLHWGTRNKRYCKAARATKENQIFAGFERLEQKRALWFCASVLYKQI